MPKELDNLDQFLEVLEEINTKALNYTAETIPKALQQEIDEHIYKAHKPSMYERTGQTLRTPRAMMGDGMIYAWYEDEGYTWRDGRNKVFPLDKWQDGEVKAPGWKQTQRTYKPIDFTGLLCFDSVDILKYYLTELFHMYGISFESNFPMNERLTMENSKYGIYTVGHDLWGGNNENDDSWDYDF